MRRGLDPRTAIKLGNTRRRPRTIGLSGARSPRKDHYRRGLELLTRWHFHHVGQDSCETFGRVPSLQNPIEGEQRD